MAKARTADVAAFGSPSAVKVWVERAGATACAACIGETTAHASEQEGFDAENIHFPPKPGVVGWADAVVAAAERLALRQYHENESRAASAYDFSS